MKKRVTFLARVAILSFLGAGLGSCGGGPGLPALRVLQFNFAPGFAGVRINAPLELTFSAPIDPNSITPDSVRVFTTTTTTDQPDPGAPARFDFPPLVIGNVVVLKPVIPQKQDLSDAGLLIGFTYTIQVPASPNVIEPIRTIEGDPNLVNFVEFFTTINATVLPAPGDITAEPNLKALNLFFIDEFDETNSLGVDPCDRSLLPIADRDSPQVVSTDPDEGEAGFGTITGIQAGLGTAFVRLDPITIDFSEPVGPWRIRAQNITIRNTNLGGETFDLFFFFTQDRTHSRLQITVFDADSGFDQASVPQGRYVLELTDFTDLAGNLVVNTGTCSADPTAGGGTFQLSFSTVSSPALPTDFTLTFGDDDGEGHVDYGGLDTSVNDPNVLPEFMAPFLGGFSVDHVSFPSPSRVHSSANWGHTAFWTGCEVFYNNGFDPVTGGDLGIFDSIRLRGGSDTAATAIMAPIAGNGSGPSAGGTIDGSRSADQRPPALGGPGDASKVDFFAEGGVTISFFTGTAMTGPIVYHFARFDLEDDAAGVQATLTYRKLDPDDSIYPMIILVEEAAVIKGIVNLDGADGQFGYNGDNSGAPGPRASPGGIGGFAGAGGGPGGNGGSFIINTALAEDINGQTGGVPFNVLGPLDELSEAMAGLQGMAPGGGGHYDNAQDEDNSVPFVPAYQGGGGASQGSGGGAGSDFDGITVGGSDQGVRGIRFGSDPGIGERAFQGPVLATGGAGGGGGGADDDGTGGGATTDDDQVPDTTDDGGGGGGGGGGFFGLACSGDVTLGEVEDDGMGGLTVHFATLRCVGGRGGSSYAFTTGGLPALWDDSIAGGGNNDGVVDPGELTADLSGQIGQGEAAGGGGGGNMCILAGNQLNLVAAELYVFGKRGGNAPDLEGGATRPSGAGAPLIEGGPGGAGVIVFGDSDGFGLNELPVEIGGGNDLIDFLPDPFRDLDMDGDLDLVEPGPDMIEGTADDVPADPASAAILSDFAEMSGFAFLAPGVYGDDPREPLFGTTVIVTEFVDTLTDFVSYDEIRTLSNAPRFPDGTITVFLDATQAGPGGLPDLSTENPDGTLNPPAGGGETASLTSNPFPPMFPGDPDIGDDVGIVQYESRSEIGLGSNTLLKRFARARIEFDLTRIVNSPLNPNMDATPRQLLLGLPSTGGGADLVLGDDPNTPIEAGTVAAAPAPTATVFADTGGCQPFDR